MTPAPQTSSKQLFPIPVVRAIITDSQHRILLLRRTATAHAAQQWCLPGGKIDYGQTAIAAIMREVAEETALLVVHADFFLMQDSLPPTPGTMHCINLYFTCCVSGELRLNPESDAHAWVAQHDVTQYAIAFHNDEAMRRYWEHTNNKL